MRPGSADKCYFARESSNQKIVYRFLQQRALRFVASALAFFLACSSFVLRAQTRSLIRLQIDPARKQPVGNHHPLWANAANDLGVVAPAEQVQDLTLILNRPDEREKALEEFLSEQQDPASPNYHHWLTPQEVGERFGLSDEDINAVATWLQSQGLQVKWIAPSRVFVGFGGTAADISRAFGTELHRYNVNGQTRISINSEAFVPAAVVPAIKAIHGLYTVAEEPQHVAQTAYLDLPQITTSSGNHYIGPGDFFNIYNLPSGTYGSGVTIGILGRARTNPADFTNFNTLLSAHVPLPTEIVPTAFGGADPGPAYTSPPGSGISTADQGEATLDVMRAGSVAWQSNLLLVVASTSSGGIATAAQYLINTTPVPVQVMTISYGACELAAGPSGVNYWDAVFKQAAAEGITSFVSSGDSGASGCDRAFTAPPASPLANSPNYICSSSYATCVGGTQFNDTGATPYWNSGGSLGATAAGYIPEGGWNESWNGTTPTVAASGGGVSSQIPTPSWQQGIPGVPASNAGRYTPDISFSSSMHDGYFGCFAAGGGDCVITNGSFYFTIFAGTSAAAPSMAGISAILDQSEGSPQGNINPGLYQMELSAPFVYHDVSLDSLGSTSCDLNTPSLCNNSIPGSTGLAGGQAGYAVGTGYDEVTGLGSFGVTSFISAYAISSKIITPIVHVAPNSSPVNQDIQLSVSVSTPGVSYEPTGTVVLTVGGYTSSPTTLLPGSYYTFTIPAGKLAQGVYTASVAYTPDATSANIFNPATGTGQLTVGPPQYISPAISLNQAAWYITKTQAATISVRVGGGNSHPIPTGTANLMAGAFTSGPTPLISNTQNNDGEAVFTIPAGTLPIGTTTLSVIYAPDTASASLYQSGTATAPITNVGDKIAPTVQLVISNPDTTNVQSFTFSTAVYGYVGNPTPTGSVVVSGGNYTSAAISLPSGSGSVQVTIPAGALAIGPDQLTVTYTPDSQSTSIYAGGSGTGTVNVFLSPKIAPAITLTQVTLNPTTVQPIVYSISLNGGAANPVPEGNISVTLPNFVSPPSITLSGGTGTLTIPAGTLPGGTTQLIANYTPAGNAIYWFTNSTATTSVSVSKATPTITVTPSLLILSTQQPLPITVNVSAGTGNLSATGKVNVSAGSYTSPATVLDSFGNAGATIVSGLLPPGTITVTATYTGDSRYNSGTGASSVVVSAPSGAGFGLTGTNATVSRGASTSSTITVTPVNGFVGNVALSASITASPAGAQNPPSLTFGGNSSVNLLLFNPSTASLAISTTATSGSLESPILPGSHWYPGGTAVLACVMILFVPLRRRSLNLVRPLVLFAILAATISCGGGGGSSSGGGVGSGGGGSSGTTPGPYTITLTGTSGSITSTTTLTLTVQ